MSAAGSTTDVHSQDHIPSEDANCAETSPDEDSLVEEPKIFQNFNHRDDAQKPRYMIIDSDTSSTDIVSSDSDSAPEYNFAENFRFASLDKNNNGDTSIVAELNVGSVNNLFAGVDDGAANSVETPSSSTQVDLFEDVGRVIALVKSRGHVATLDPNTVYEKLENVQYSYNRVMVVADEIVHAEKPDVIVLNYDGVGVESHVTQQDRTGQENPPASMMPEVELVRSVCPEVSVAEVRGLMETYEGHPDRVNLVIDHLLTRPKTIANNNVAQATDTAPLLAVDAPDIIAVDNDVLSSNGDKAPDIVFNADGDKAPDIVFSAEKQTVVDTDVVAEDLTIGVDPQPSTSASNAFGNEKPLPSPGSSDHWTLLREMLPDADPDYLLAIVDQCRGNIEELMKQVNTCMELRTYPKLTEAIQRQEQHTIKRKYLERNFTIDEFLQLYDDPVGYFYNTERPVSNIYKEHVMAQLSNDFGLVYKEDLVKILQKHNYHLTPAYRELQKIYGGNNEPGGKRRKCVNQRCKKKATPHQPLPDTFDEMFYKEVVFLELEEALKAGKKEMEEYRNVKLESAKLNNELCTCGCCFDDELLLEEMLTCSDGHMFCKECIRRSSEENIGQGKLKFPCLSSDCKSDIPLQTLQEALKPAVFSNLVRRLQEEEIRLAAIDDLVSCPFCSFSAIMPNPQDKVFKCLNPECLKESCRLCREANHVPLRCEEVEKSQEVKMRTYIEDKMTESLLRTCPRCKRRFIKLDGCNKMTCQCGQIMCYVCRKPITGYEHFGNGRCPQFSDDHQLHVLEVQRGAEKAKQELLQEHPELDQLQLKHDPTKDLVKGTQHVPGARPVGGFVPVLENDRIVFHHNQQPGHFPVHAYAQIPWIQMPQIPQMPFMPVLHQFPFARVPAREMPRRPPPPPPRPRPPPPPPPPVNQYPAGQRPADNRYVIENRLQAIVNTIPVLNTVLGIHKSALRPQPVPVEARAAIGVPTNITQPNTFPTVNVQKSSGTVGQGFRGPVTRVETGNPTQPVATIDPQRAKNTAVVVSVRGKKGAHPHQSAFRCSETVGSNQPTVIAVKHSSAYRPVPAITLTNRATTSGVGLDSSANQRNIPNQIIDKCRNGGNAHRKRVLINVVSSARNTIVDNHVQGPSADNCVTTLSKTNTDSIKCENGNDQANSNAASLSSVTNLVFANPKPISTVLVPSKFPLLDKGTVVKKQVVTNSLPSCTWNFQGARVTDSTAVNFLSGSEVIYVNSSKQVTSNTNPLPFQVVPNLTPASSPEQFTVIANNTPKPTAQSGMLSTPTAVAPRVISAISAATSILKPNLLKSNAAVNSSRSVTGSCGPIASSAASLQPAGASRFQMLQNNTMVIRLPSNNPPNLISRPVSGTNPSVGCSSVLTLGGLVTESLTRPPDRFTSYQSSKSERPHTAVTVQRTTDTVEEVRIRNDPSSSSTLK